MRTSIAIVVVLLTLALAPGTLTGRPAPVDPEGRPVLAAADAASPTGDVLEVRFLLLRPKDANGIDLRLKHVLGDATTDPSGRFFTVAEKDPEKIVERLAALGTVEVLDRGNLPLRVKKAASYGRQMRVPVAQIEERNEQYFLRWKYESVGTKLDATDDGEQLSLKIEASAVIGMANEHHPLIGTAFWRTTSELASGRTAVFRSHWRLPARPKTDDAEAKPAEGVTLIVLMTRSTLP